RALKCLPARRAPCMELARRPVRFELSPTNLRWESLKPDTTLKGTRSLKGDKGIRPKDLPTFRWEITWRFALSVGRSTMLGILTTYTVRVRIRHRASQLIMPVALKQITTMS